MNTHGSCGIMFIDIIRCNGCGRNTIRPEDEEYFSEWDDCLCYLEMEELR